MIGAAPAGFEQRLRKPLHTDDIGGGKVRRGFRMGDKMVAPGTVLSAEQIAAIPIKNQMALVGRFIEVWPRDPKPSRPLHRLVVHTGSGNYDVIEGVKLNDGPLDKESARALAEQKGA